MKPWVYIHLTKSQRDSLLGQLKYVNLDTGLFYCHHTCWVFLNRIGAVEHGYVLSSAGMSLMADYGNDLKVLDRSKRQYISDWHAGCDNPPVIDLSRAILV